MSWNYRVIKDKESYGIHEVYYAENGEMMYSQLPIGVSWNEGESGAAALDMMAEALDKPVLTEDDFKGEL